MFKIETRFDDGGVQIALNEMPKEFNGILIKELIMIANDMRNHIIREMRKSPPNKGVKLIRSGTRYKVNAKNRRYHYPSYPGNFPRIDRGRLAGSINVENGNEWVGVGSAKIGSLEIARYAKYLEDEKGLNRPFIKPTYAKFAPTIQARLMDAIRSRATKK